MLENVRNLTAHDVGNTFRIIKEHLKNGKKAINAQIDLIVRKVMDKEMVDDYKILEDAIRNSYGSVVWSHKIQEKQSDIYAEKLKKMETINIGAASLTSVGIIGMIFTDPLWLKLISALISFATVYITAYFKSFDLQKLITSHKATANKLIAIRDQYKVLLTELKLQSDSVENLLSRYNELVRETDDIYLEAPSTADEAAERASKALKIKKDNTFSDEEIDLFLPISLRRETNEQ